MNENYEQMEKDVEHLPVAHVVIKQRDKAFTRRVVPNDVTLLLNGVELPWTDFELCAGMTKGVAKMTVTFWVDRLDVESEMLLQLDPKRSKKASE